MSDWNQALYWAIRTTCEAKFPGDLKVRSALDTRRRRPTMTADVIVSACRRA